MEKGDKILIPERLPLIPLRDLVVFPHMVIPLFIGRERSIRALEEATYRERIVALVTQKRPSIDDPKEADLYNIGTASEVLQLLKLSDGTVKILAEGLSRIKIEEFIQSPSHNEVIIKEMEEVWEYSPELEAMMRTLNLQFEEYVKLNGRIHQEVLTAVSNIEDPGRLADAITSQLTLKANKKQEILEMIDPFSRLEKVSMILNAEIEILQIEKRIHNRVKQQIEKTQREYYLQEQLHAIQRELGRRDDEIESLREKIEGARMSKEAYEKALKELKRLESMPPTSSETAVIRNYLDWLINLPWSTKTRDRLHIERAKEILEKDHYGLPKVKERVLEYLAVRKLVKRMKGPILCFVGPPGTGKTSVARSIARALGRRFIRISLGGVRDEAEIRGHRMTYVAALPGRIIQSMRKVGSRNPVFLLDEVDKMSVDFRGDPSSALLEVLDPEQNQNFSDHYLEVPFDLSDVMFITTANIPHSIPYPLRDRMEIIEFPSYIEEEKLKIAQLFLIPKLIKTHGLRPKNLSFSKDSIPTIINRYTREAGVRDLERQISKIMRKIAKEVASKGRDVSVRIISSNLHRYLGPPRYKSGLVEREGRIGVVNGLAWTEIGGVVLVTEAIVMPGKGELILTGKLGEIMKESGQAALSFARSRAKILGIDPDSYKDLDIHIHLPEGAVPKDGPSAGITMGVALVSALTNRKVRADIAMTGELTLRGRVLPVGGIKEKLLAAYRNGIKNVIIPKDNERDLEDIPKEVRRALEINLVESMDEVLSLAMDA